MRSHAGLARVSAGDAQAQPRMGLRVVGIQNAHLWEVQMAAAPRKKRKATIRSIMVLRPAVRNAENVGSTVTHELGISPA